MLRNVDHETLDEECEVYNRAVNEHSRSLTVPWRRALLRAKLGRLTAAVPTIPPNLVLAISGHCETSRRFIAISSTQRLDLVCEGVEAAGQGGVPAGAGVGGQQRAQHRPPAVQLAAALAPHRAAGARHSCSCGARASCGARDMGAQDLDEESVLHQPRLLPAIQSQLIRRSI